MEGNETITLEEFVNSIKIDFTWVLYSSTYTNEATGEQLRLHYPYCCQLASQIIASFLNEHFSKTAKCMKIEYNGPLHFWCECDGIVIDFTDFQFSINNETKQAFLEYRFDKNSFIECVENQQIQFLPNTYFHKYRPCSP